MVAALGATADLTVRWQGEQLDRLADATHALIVERAASEFGSAGWLTRVEVSFNHFGDRGRVDLLAFHPVGRILIVAEAKSAIGDTQDTVGRLDVKARLGPMLAESVGWGEVSHVLPALVIGDSRTARRVVGRHGATFGRFTLRGRSALAWLRRPGPPVPSGLLWFTNVPDSRETGATRTRRVRRDRMAS